MLENFSQGSKNVVTCYWWPRDDILKCHEFLIMKATKHAWNKEFIVSLCCCFLFIEIPSFI